MIDVTFDFTSDTPGYWDCFWDNDLGYSKKDPDSTSKTLNLYHKLLWSKALPNGEMMELKDGKNGYYLTWGNFSFGSDSIITSFRYIRYKYMMDQVKERVGDYRAYYEDFLRKTYTIGGAIIFPKHKSSMNQKRGTNKLISDRWDLTLECIRRFYKGEDSPLYATMEADRAFYELFVDFKGYVDFFFLQDAVSADYSSVDIWCGTDDFKEDALPKTVDEYFAFIDKELQFLGKRNERIKEYSEKHIRNVYL